MEDLLAVFIHEAREKLAEMESGLLCMNADSDPDTLNAVFRAAHTIKGSAGVVEQDAIVGFTHRVEHVLDRVRNGELAVERRLVDLLLECGDHVGLLVDRLESDGSAADAALQARGEALCESLRAFACHAGERGEGECGGGECGGGEGDSGAARSCAEGALPPDVPPLAAGAAAGAIDTGALWHIGVAFGPDVFKRGVDPIAVLGQLSAVGEIERLDTRVDGVPGLDALDAEGCYLEVQLALRSAAGRAAIESVFEFIRDECRVSLRAADEMDGEGGDGSGAAAAPHEPDAAGGPADEADRRGGSVTGSARAQATPRAEATPRRREEPAPARPAPNASRGEARLIRVHADKLDRLIDLIGELVIAGASTNLLAQRSRQAELVEATSVLARLVESVRESALKLRMVQIGETFSRFNRVVRETAKELGKEAQLVVSGGDTELDKSVVDRIGEPLMHLVRNAIDHGLEGAEERRAKGKPAAGTVRLNAFHDSGSIVIEVGDDGGGLRKDRIRAKALENGLITENQPLSDAEIADLIFAPGFSTAGEVSDISGRGVGMDVVRRNIEALRGGVEVKSEEGRGSLFTIRLPLTLAIIDAFLVGVARSAFAIPLETVVECTELADSASEDRDYIDLRGEALPVVRLRRLFGLDGGRPARESVVVVRAGARKAGIVVDVLHGELQAVIKPLGSMFRNLRAIAGSTILGSGEVALILDVHAIIKLAAHADARRTAALST